MNKSETYNRDVLGYYRIIGITPDTDENLAKQKYRERAKAWHPDHNSSDEAKENFQKLSVAYDIISNDDKRLTYDLLCSAYTSSNFPPMFSLKPYRNMEGKDDFNLKTVSLTKVIGKILKQEIKKEDKICNYKEAVREVFKVSLNNWLLGWWSIKAFPENIKALVSNFYNIGHNRAENYRLWLHNALAYWQNKQVGNAYISAVIAGQYADDTQKVLLKKLLSRLGLKPKFQLKNWNMLLLQAVQLIMPIIIIIAALLPLSVKIVSESDLWQIFSQDKKIIYNQEVRFSSGGSMSDDMVVGKIIKIPVDITDVSKLYHVTSEQKVMYGPADDFDVLKRIKNGTTVRITGISPDEIWYRVMLDEGEMGFIRKEFLAPGIGNDIPYGSQIFSK